MIKDTMINITIKANVQNITLSDIYEILSIYIKPTSDIIKFKGFGFKVETEVNESINYTITELK